MSRAALDLSLQNRDSYPELRGREWRRWLSDLCGEVAPEAFSHQSDVGCKNNRVGIMCAHCRQGYRPAGGSDCTKCPEGEPKSLGQSNPSTSAASQNGRG